jgi:hypothetical protein
MTRWPWVTGVLVVIVAALPLTRDIFYAAYISAFYNQFTLGDDRSMREQSQEVFCAGVAIAVLLGFIEWGIRTIMVRRRARPLVAGARAQDGELGG